MMTAKARGKNQVVLFDDSATERPAVRDARGEDIRSIAHLKMLQSLGGKLNRSNDVREIGMAIANELRLLIDYHNCRVFVRDGDELAPIAFQGELTAPDRSRARGLPHPRRRGDHRPRRRDGRAAPPRGRRRSASSPIAIEGTTQIDESIIAVPLNYGTRVIGAIVVSKLGLDQFDEDDLRLLEVLAGPRGGRAREREPLRGAAARGREREGAARVRPRARRRGRPRPRADARRRGRRAADRRAARLALAAGRARGDLVGPAPQSATRTDA